MTTGSFQATLTTAGTQQQITATLDALRSVVIKAMPANTGTIYVGPTGVTSSNGFPLAAGDSIALDALSIAKLFFNATVNGDKISVFWTGP